MLHKKGFVAGTDGNLSVRIDSTHILSTPTSVSKALLRPADMVVVGLDGSRIWGTRDPSSEIGMHLKIYKIRPDVQAIVHAHPCTATGFASAGLALDQPLCSEIILTLGKIPLAPYEAPGSTKLGEALAPFVVDHDAILMANHGVVAYGRDLLSAYLNMEIVEHFARIMLVAKQLGRCQPLAAESVHELLQSRMKNKNAAFTTRTDSSMAYEGRQHAPRG